MKKFLISMLCLVISFSFALLVLNWPQIYPLVSYDESPLNYRVVNCNDVPISEQDDYIRCFDTEMDFEDYSVCELIIEIQNSNPFPVNYVKLKNIEDITLDGEKIVYISEKNVYLNANFKHETFLNENEVIKMSIILFVKSEDYKLIKQKFNVCEFRMDVCGKNTESFLNFA